jgi:SAM-dependent methyltransferase
MAENPRDDLREIWRVLAPGGRVIIVVPNRRGLWAHVEATPFGYGRPFSRGQLTALLRDALFSPLGWMEALAVPPFAHRPWLRNGATWERVGRTLWPAFAGVILVEATKQLYQGIPTRKRSRALKPALSPALAPPASARNTLSG